MQAKNYKLALSYDEDYAKKAFIFFSITIVY